MSESALSLALLGGVRVGMGHWDGTAVSFRWAAREPEMVGLCGGDWWGRDDDATANPDVSGARPPHIAHSLFFVCVTPAKHSFLKVHWSQTQDCGALTAGCRCGGGGDGGESATAAGDNGDAR